MWFTPSSRALCRTAIERPRSLGVPWWKAALPVSRIAPKPRRRTGRSPRCQVPDASAVIVSEVIGGVWHTAPRDQQYRLPPAGTPRIWVNF
jgi:hypothetical protein